MRIALHRVAVRIVAPLYFRFVKSGKTVPERIIRAAWRSL